MPDNCSSAWTPLGWSTFYATDLCGRAFQALYTDQPPFKWATQIQLLWSAVARRFKEHPGVLAYELFNEPWAGDILQHPEYLVEPHKADAALLAPFYRGLHDAIRREDDEHVLMFGPVEIGDRLMGQVGFDTGPGGPAYNDRQSLIFHDYCVIGTDGPGPQPGIPRRLCNATDDATVAVRMKDALRLNTTLMMTEFGAVSSGQQGLEEIRVVADAADGTHPPTSWAYWDWNAIRNTSDARWGAVSRSYVQVTAGRLLSMSVGRPGLFAATLVTSSAVAGDPASRTLVYLSREFSMGFEVTLEPAGAARWSERGHIRVR